MAISKLYRQLKKSKVILNLVGLNKKADLKATKKDVYDNILN